MVVGVGVLAVLGGIVYFGYNRPAPEVISAARTNAAQARPTVAPRPATTVPSPALRMAERMQPMQTTPPSSPEDWEQAVRNFTMEEARKHGRREVSRVTYAKLQRFIEESGLMGAARKHLEQLLANKQSVDVDVRTTARKLGVSSSDPQVQALLRSERAAIDNEIRSLVGDDFFGRIEAGLFRTEDRLYAVEFIGELYQRGMPLSAEKRAMVNQFVTYLDAGDAQRWVHSTVDPASGLTAYDSSMLRELASSLTPEQLEVVRQVQIERNLYLAFQDYQKSRLQKNDQNAGGG